MPHAAHEGGYVVAADEEAPVKEFVLDPPAPVKGKLQMDLVDGRHEGQIPVARARGLVIEARAGEVEKVSLSGEGQGVVFVDHLFALGPCVRPSAADKKSFSMVSSPILA